MQTLLISREPAPAEQALVDAAAALGWRVRYFTDDPVDVSSEGLVIHVDTTDALEAAERFGLTLLEPPLDLLARLPRQFTQRQVEFGRFADLPRLRTPTFLKPADALGKVFDAGIYQDVRDIFTRHPIPPETPVLVSEPVEFLAEYRCFVVEGEVATTSPYMSFGRPNWRAYGLGGEKAVASQHVLAFCDRLVSQCPVELPPGFVVDVGLIEDRGWAIVEFNPAWSSGLLGAEPKGVLHVLERTCRSRENLTELDRRWVVERNANCSE